MITLEKKIESETLTIPQLKQFIGKELIIKLEEKKSKKSYKKFLSAVGKIDIDEKEIDKNRNENLI